MSSFLGHEVTQEFGVRRDKYDKYLGYHAGIDLRYSQGQALEAFVSGVVTAKSWTDGSGWYIKLRASDGSEHVDYHLSRFSGFNVGNQVNKGQVIGYAGNTGDSDGPHRHYGVKVNGQFIDPRVYHGGNMSDAQKVIEQLTEDNEFRKGQLTALKNRAGKAGEWQGEPDTKRVIKYIDDIEWVANKRFDNANDIRDELNLPHRNSNEVDDIVSEIKRLKQNSSSPEVIVLEPGKLYKTP